MKIECTSLQKAYPPDFLLDIPGLIVREGDYLALVGNNGSGKTTFLQLLVDLVQATRGSISINGHNVNKEEWKPYSAVYLNENFLIGFFTVKEYFEFVCSFYFKEFDVIQKLQEYDFYKKSELPGKLNRQIRTLSRGNRDKVGIIAALITDPSLLILDEPYAHLDISSRHLFNETIRGLKGKIPVMLISSHDIHEVKQIANRIILLDKGKIIHDLEATESDVNLVTRYLKGLQV